MQNDLFVRVWNSVSSADTYSETAPGYVSLVHASPYLALKTKQTTTKKHSFKLCGAYFFEQSFSAEPFPFFLSLSLPPPPPTQLHPHTPPPLFSDFCFVFERFLFFCFIPVLFQFCGARGWVSVSVFYKKLGPGCTI